VGHDLSDPGKLIAEMVTIVEKERGALPLLAFAAARLWEERDREKRLLTRPASPTGWKLEPGPFPGWEKLPHW
jgi:hypothetical protein